jgi:alpha-L-fucosidase 2
MINVIKGLATVLFFCFFNFLNVKAQENNNIIWYNQPAKIWEETLPLGNGRLGMTPTSGIQTDEIVLNDITLWSGQPQEANKDSAYTYLPQIRMLLKEGKNKEAEAIINKHFVAKGAGSGSGNGANVPFGCYQTLGNLYLKYQYDQNDTTNVRDYKRELNLNTAVASCSYKIGDITYNREYFTSFDDDLDVIKLSASEPNKLNLIIGLDRGEKFETVADSNGLIMKGQLENGTDGKGMRYKVRLQTLLQGGNLEVVGNTLHIKNANQLILLISAGTDYKIKNYESVINEELESAQAKTYGLQKKNHITSYSKYFDRVALKLGTSSRNDLPTDQRLNEFMKDNKADDELAVLFFQFGRYLSISSTRPGILPPNLQGLWAKNVQTPWNGDYHLDVNVQMNHWPLETVNLSELNLPLKDLVKGLVEPGKETAKAYYNSDGWVGVAPKCHFPIAIVL